MENTKYRGLTPFSSVLCKDPMWFPGFVVVDVNGEWASSFNVGFRWQQRWGMENAFVSSFMHYNQLTAFLEIGYKQTKKYDLVLHNGQSPMGQYLPGVKLRYREQSHEAYARAVIDLNHTNRNRQRRFQVGFNPEDLFL